MMFINLFWAVLVFPIGVCCDFEAVGAENLGIACLDASSVDGRLRA